MTGALWGYDAAALDVARARPWAIAIIDAAMANAVPPSVIAAIGSRETRWHERWVLPPPRGELGDGGNGHGPLQIDRRYYPDFCARWRAGEASVEEGIHMGAGVLAEKLRAVQRRLPNLADEHRQLRLAIAGYNASLEKVIACHLKGTDIDQPTTGKNYSADVLARVPAFEPLFSDTECKR